MKIKKITIKNFRGIDILDGLDLSDFNVFVGKNDAGKSIILNAFNCFFNEKIFSQEDAFKGKQEGENTVIELSFSLSKDVDDLITDCDKLFTIKKEFIVAEKGKIKINTYYKVNDFKNTDYQDLWNKKEDDLNKIVESLGGEVVKSGRGNKNLLRIEQIKTLLPDEERAAVYNPIGDILKIVDKNYDLKQPEYSLFGAEEDLNVGATTFQSQFKFLINEGIDNNKDITEKLEDEVKKGLEKEFGEIRDIMAKNVQGLKELKPTLNCDWQKAIKFNLNLSFDGESYSVPISHKGTGFKRLLMVAYFEYLSNKKNVANQIFAIEEPETFLHPSAQDNLLNSILKISKKSQFFITTHSPVFAGQAKGENSVLVTKNEQGISKYERGGAIVENIIKELGIKSDYNLLENAKFLIFVEGRDDLQFLQIAAKTFLDKDLEENGILCVIGGGSSLKNYADLKLFKKLSGNTNKYAVLVDGDNGDVIKEREKAAIQAQCDEDQAIFYKLTKREIENYCCPDCIKLSYINEIKEKEGAESQNPRLAEIEGITLEFDENTDVEEHLKNIGLHNFKSGYNIKTFSLMNKSKWEEIDALKEIETFVNSVYSKLD